MQKVRSLLTDNRQANVSFTFAALISGDASPNSGIGHFRVIYLQCVEATLVDQDFVSVIVAYLSSLSEPEYFRCRSPAHSTVEAYLMTFGYFFVARQFNEGGFQSF